MSGLFWQALPYMAGMYLTHQMSEKASDERREAQRRQSEMLQKAGKPPSREDPAIKEAEREERLAMKKRRGRKSTILTNGMGLGEEATLGKKTLLGA